MKSLTLVVDMKGCPNRCKHCWLGHFNNTPMEDNADEFLVDYFKNYFENITFYSWLREPDYTKAYVKRWNKDNEISINVKPQRFELASFYKLNRDKNYVKFLKDVGVKVVQLTFFGLEEMTDKYVGRKGAFKELVNATNILIENGIAPRYQAFLNAENKEDVVKLLQFIDELKLYKRCENIGVPFNFFVHEGSCDGENRKLYDIRINKEDIPKELIPYHLDYDQLLTEKECCEILVNDNSSYVPHNSDQIVLNITSNYDVYYNFTHISPNWKIGNIKNDVKEELIRKIINEDTFALNKARNISLRELVLKYGDKSSNKIFYLDDYKLYLLNCYIDSESDE